MKPQMLREASTATRRVIRLQGEEQRGNITTDEHRLTQKANRMKEPSLCEVNIIKHRFFSFNSRDSRNYRKQTSLLSLRSLRFKLKGLING